MQRYCLQLKSFIYPMIYTRLFILAFSFLSILDSSMLSAHEIHLKSGSVIKTDYLSRTGSQLSYKQFGGLVTISLSEVDQIKYDTKPVTSSRSGARTYIDSGEEPLIEGDLAAHLQEKLSPRTPIETANLSVVSIKTEAGSGSGFFINEKGLIVTNRHVVRGSRTNDLKTEKQIGEVENRLLAIRQGLEREKERLDQYDKNLKISWARVKQISREQGDQIDQDQLGEAQATLKQKGKYLASWRSDYETRRKRFLKESREFEMYRNDFRQAGDRLARQSRFTITLADGSEKSAILYRVSDQVDLALLKVNGYQTPYLQPVTGNKPALGQRVFAIGSPLQLNNSVTSGVISNYRGEYIQTNAEIYPGNSGGPLVTEDGQVIGVNTMKMITEKFEGLGFAIPFSRVRSEFKDFLQE